MPHAIISPSALREARALRDLTDPAQGPHAVQRVVEAAIAALRARWGCAVHVERADPVVTVADNYDRLLYPPGAAARDARYTRYVAPGQLLRTQTSAMIPPVLRRLAADPAGPLAGRPDLIVACPGLVWRRDRIDRLHVGEPHQFDLWRLRRGQPLASADLEEMLHAVAGAVAPGRAVRLERTVHPYTAGGLQVEVAAAPGAWVEIAECGLAHPRLLAESGLPPEVTGLAMGLGLDRLVMLAKGLDDIRALRDPDPRVAAQLLDLAPWRPVSHHPPVRRDLSLAIDQARSAEELGDRVREALGARAADVEGIEVLSEVAGPALPPAAQARLGLGRDQKNVLLRLALRALGRTPTDAEANLLRDEVYAALHEGARHEWACGGPPWLAAS